MDLTYDELHAKTVAELRDIASELEYDSLHGYSTMHKEQLLPALCEALGVEAHVHHEVVGIDKKKMTAEIRELKAKRDAAREAGDRQEFKKILRRIHRLKGDLRRHTV